MASKIEQLKEQLAAIEHIRWADWQKWMHGVCEQTEPAGGLFIPAALVERWNRQIATPYAELSEQEKASDREQVDRYWPLIAGLIDPERRAREQARIARLEAAAKQILESTEAHETDGGITLIYQAHLDDLKAALDGPVDPTAPKCRRCGKALNAEEITYYHDRCEACEIIHDAELVAAFEADDDADAARPADQAEGAGT